MAITIGGVLFEPLLLHSAKPRLEFGGSTAQQIAVICEGFTAKGNVRVTGPRNSVDDWIIGFL